MLKPNLKTLQDNIGKNLDDFGYHYDFLDKTPEAQSMKEIIRWTSLNLKISVL